MLLGVLGFLIAVVMSGVFENVATVIFKCVFYLEIYKNNIFFIF